MGRKNIKISFSVKTIKDRVLRKKSVPLDESFSKGDLTSLLLSLKAVLFKKGALGISAVQLGHPVRVALIRTAEDDAMVLINPEIVVLDEETETMEEGCLSCPGAIVKVARPKEILLKTQTLDGKNLEMRLDGLQARIVMHEVDHMDGKLIIDSRG